MICNRCLRVASHRLGAVDPSPLSRSVRFLSTSTSARAAINSAAPRAGDSTHQHPAATSTSAAQPFSTPATPSPKAAGVGSGKPSAPPAIALSSVPAGTPLKGLNFLKNKTDPVALEDSEYPPWLWDVLKKDSKAGAADDEGDLFSKSKKQRRLAAKRLRKQALLNPDLLVPKVPIYEQSIDLPAGDGTLQGAKEASEARDALRKAMRDKRRSKIKETNFLKTMG